MKTTKIIMGIASAILVSLLSLSGCGGSSPAAAGGGGPTTGGTTILMGGTTNVALNITGLVSSFTGTASTAMTVGAVDGASTAATFNMPYGITTDGTNLYVADYGNNKIRKIVIATGVVSILAGSGVQGTVDGASTAATFNWPTAITTDGTNLYVTDQSNNKIRKIVIATGVVSTLAGSGVVGATDGTGIAATFNWPSDITTDGTNLYVADTLNNKIRKIVIATGVVSTLAGSGALGAVDGVGLAATFGWPTAITTDGTNLYVADLINNKIRKIVIATGVVSTLAGSGVAGATDGTGTAATFNRPTNITTDGTNLYVVDQGNNKIRKIVIATGVVSTLAGSGAPGAVDGTSIAATFGWPTGITTDGRNLYVADQGNNKIRKIQ